MSTPTAPRVPYANLAQEAGELRAELVRAFEKVITSGKYVLGSEVAAFEQEFAAYCGTSHAVGMANGTCALHLVWRAMGIQPGDEIITAPNSFIATASTIALAGARPVFVDIGPDLNIAPEKIAAAITPRTRGIVPVHLAGRPARMPAILEIARKHNLFVLEDAAQAVGAKLDGKPVGSWGDAACFSLHPLKNLHVYGDGGMVTTRDAALIDRLKLARNHGLRNRDQCDFWSFNCRLDELQAALARVEMTRLDERTRERRRLALRYHEKLKPHVEVPSENKGEHCVYQTYVVQAEKRNELKEFLNANGVEALVHYPTPIHMQPAAASLGYKPDDFPGVRRAADRILSLPLYPGLAESQQDFVVDLIAKFFK